MGRIDAICVSETKGMRKGPVQSVHFLPDHGIQGDAHAGPWHRQVSLLCAEDIERIHRQRLPDLSPGDFAENLIVSGLDLQTCGLGTQLRLGADVVLRLSQIGKVCHTPCRIFYMTGECAMPGLGLFARAEQGGRVFVGDPITCINKVDRDLYQAVVLTVSDPSGPDKDDRLGPAMTQVLETKLPAHVYRCIAVADDQESVEETLKHYCDGHSIDLIVIARTSTSSPNDSAARAARQVIDGSTPWLDESMQLAAACRTSAVVSGTCKSTLIINLPTLQHEAPEYLRVIADAVGQELVNIRDTACWGGSEEKKDSA